MPNIHKLTGHSDNIQWHMMIIELLLQIIWSTRMPHFDKIYVYSPSFMGKPYIHTSKDATITSDELNSKSEIRLNK